MKTNTINSAADRASKFVEMAQDKASDWAERGAEKLHDADEQVQKAVKSNPYPALGIAFGVGLALGYLLTPSRK